MAHLRRLIVEGASLRPTIQAADGSVVVSAEIESRLTAADSICGLFGEFAGMLSKSGQCRR